MKKINNKFGISEEPKYSRKITTVKDDIVNILVFVGHMVSVSTTQLYHCCAKAAINNT